MSHLRLLIVNSSPEFCRTMTDLTRQFWETDCCHTGRQALERLRRSHYDLLLLDLELPELDGITVLKSTQSEGICPATLVTLTWSSPYISQALSQLQISYAMVKPCLPAALLTNLEGMAAAQSATSAPAPTRQDPAEALLLRFHLNPKHDGYHYFLSALPLFAGKPNQFITKELYSTVGKLYGKKPNQVERSMRTALESAWKVDDDGIWLTYFPGMGARPSNKSFIITASQLLSASADYLAG